ncbi:MAG: PIN domain-containing protein [Candidatus Cloacimonetes bacterium]|nr:PIN domain-containing protein [Candidatus Cloacimonadota bacterium]
MYLADTNIFLHILLKKEKYQQVLNFLKGNYEIYITEFSLYSICILLSKLKEFDILNIFVSDIISCDFITIIGIEPEEIKKIVEIERNYNLDFDDAYQYYIALREDITIVSYDKDFEKTPKGRKIPELIIS